MKTALFKDTHREILRSFSRFLSIFLIIFIGCGFYAGINSTMPDMNLTAKEYFDATNLMDLKLVSTIGIKAEDIKNVKSLDFVEGVSVGYSKDVFYKNNGQNLVLKFMSLNDNHTSDSDNINKLTLIEGKMPEKSGECVVDQKFRLNDDGFELGSQITVTSPYADADIDEILTTDKFTIVGYVTTPLYIGYERDKTTVGNGNVSGFVFVNENDFNLDYYSEMFVTLKNCDLEPFSDEYLQQVDKYRNEVVDAFSKSVNDRYDYLYNLYSDKISSAQSKISQLEQILSSDLSQLYSQKAQIENSISELEKQLETSTSTILKFQLSKAKTSLSQIESLIEARDNNDVDYLAQLENQLGDAKNEISNSKYELENISDPVILSYDRFSNSDYGSFEGDSRKIHAIGKIFPVFFIIVSALVCLTTVSRMIEEQRTQIGIYKALGYSSFQIASKYLIYGLVASVSGSFFGTIVGSKILPVVIYNCYKILYNIPIFLNPVSWTLVIACVSVSAILVCIVVIYSCFSELSAQPSQLMRPRPPKSGRRVLLEKFPKIWNKISFIGKVTIRNLLRYKKRFLMTIFGVAGCTALILTGFGLKHSISAILDLQFEKIFCYDGMALIDCSKNDPYEVMTEISKLDNVTKCDLSCQVGCEIPNGIDTYTATIVVMDNSQTLDNYVNLIDCETDERVTLSDDGVVITQKLAQLLDLETGDNINVDLADKGSVTFKIKSIVENYALHYIYITDNLYEKTVETPTFNTCFFNLSDDADQESVSEMIVSTNGILGVTFLEENGKSFENSLNSLMGIVWLLIGCAGLLAVVVLYNLANINITERIREIATIKVLGFYDAETSAYIYRENIISAFVGIIFGWVLGIFLHQFVVKTAEVDIVMFDRSLKASAYAFSALLTMAFTALVNVVLHFKLKKVDMVSSLKSIE